MAIDYQLLRDGRVVIYNIGTALNMTELAAFVKRINTEVFDVATHEVYTIVDLSKLQHIPKNAISGCLALMRQTHPRAGVTLVVSGNGFVNTMGQVLNTAASNKLIIRKTLDEALDEVDEMIGIQS